MNTDLDFIRQTELELADEVAKFYHDPLGFVRFAYPWGEDGALKDHEGPDKWQCEFLGLLGNYVDERAFDGLSPVGPIRMGVSSGHGIGKSTLVAWLVDWIMSTRPNSQGTVSANTFSQLQSKTWAAIQKWTALCITSHWFRVGGEKMVHKDFPATWFCTAQTCREENSEAFAGQHAAESTSFYIFDEASAIPDKIYEVAEGGQTDGEPMWFLFGNPTRNSGRFHAACFGRERDYWNSRCIDSRECRFTNKALISEWLGKYGEDSDWFRVRVRGLPPRASDAQFIDSERVFEAQKREVGVLPDEPLILGVDLARGGSDDNVLRYRRGLDGRSIPAVVVPGEKARDSMFMVTKIAHEIEQRKPDAVFLDATGGSVGGPIGDRLRQLGFKVIDVQFGGQPPDARCANMRAYMWQRLKDWLPSGAIDKSIGLEMDLCGPGYHADRQDRLVLESKESMKDRGLDSPDDADALALTFAQPVMAKRPLQEVRRYVTHKDLNSSWMG